MNIMQAAKQLGVSDKTIRRAIHAGALRAHYPQKNRAEIEASDLEQWYATVTTIRATPDETQARLAALEQQVQTLTIEVQGLRLEVQSMVSMSTPVAPGYAPRQRPMQQDAAAPEGFTWLNDFADLHGMSRNEANRRWQHGMITGQKISQSKRRAPVAIAEKGQHEFWIQFHQVEGFRTCDTCPHV